MQALAAVQQRYADAPDAFVDLALADGAPCSRISRSSCSSLSIRSAESSWARYSLAPFVLQVRQQGFGRGAMQQRLRQPFLVAAAQRLRTVEQFQADRLLVAGHHQRHALLAQVGQALEFRFGETDQRGLAIEFLRQLQAGRAGQVAALSGLFFGQAPAQQGLQVPVGAAQRLLQGQRQLLADRASGAWPRAMRICSRRSVGNASTWELLDPQGEGDFPENETTFPLSGKNMQKEWEVPDGKREKRTGQHRRAARLPGNHWASKAWPLTPALSGPEVQVDRHDLLAGGVVQRVFPRVGEGAHAGAGGAGVDAVGADRAGTVEFVGKGLHQALGGELRYRIGAQ